MRGSIGKREEAKANPYFIKFDAGRHPLTGKRQQKIIRGFATKRDAQRKLNEVLAELDAGKYVDPARVTLGEFLTTWLRDYAEPQVRSRTYEGYQFIVERHLIPQLGAIHLSKLSASQLQNYYGSALRGGRLDGRGGLSAQTVKHHHRVLSEALAHAVRWGMVPRNVAQLVSPPRVPEHEAGSLDIKGVGAVLEFARETRYYEVVHLAIYTGLRRSELLGLSWPDIDFDRGTLSVRHVVIRLNRQGLHVEEPKTKRSRRMVTLGPDTLLMLRAHRETQEANYAALGLSDTPQLVFALGDSRPLSPDTVTHGVKRILRAAGYPDLGLHDLRHTHVSLMLAAGVNLKVVQERVGHSTITTTADRYAHLLPGMQEGAVELFEEQLARGRPLA